MIWERSREGAGMGSSRRDGRGHVGEQGKTGWAGVKLVLGVGHAGQESSDPVGQRSHGRLWNRRRLAMKRYIEGRGIWCWWVEWASGEFSLGSLS